MMQTKKTYLSEKGKIDIPLKKLYGETVRITATNGKVFEGVVTDYVYPEDNVPEEIEAIIIDDVISGQPIEFFEDHIKVLEILS